MGWVGSLHRLQANDRIAWESGMASPEARNTRGLKWKSDTVGGSEIREKNTTRDVQIYKTPLKKKTRNSARINHSYC